MQETWLDADQTAQSLHITKATLYKLVRRGRVPATKIHGKWRFTREAIEELFDASSGPRPSLDTSNLIDPTGAAREPNRP